MFKTKALFCVLLVFGLSGTTFAALTEEESKLESVFSNAEWAAFSEKYPDFVGSIRYQLNEYSHSDSISFRAMNFNNEMWKTLPEDIETEIRKHFVAREPGLFEKAAHVKTRKIKALPKPSSFDKGLNQEVYNAVNYWLGDKDGGATIVIKKVIVTGTKWQKMSMDDGLSARVMNCCVVLEIEKGFTLVLFDGIYQKYLGKVDGVDQFEAGMYRSYNYEDPAVWDGAPFK